MKVCNLCGEDIDGTKDGQNTCDGCEARQDAGKQKRARATIARRARNEAIKSLGLVKVRGALGGTYWE